MGKTAIFALFSIVTLFLLGSGAAIERYQISDAEKALNAPSFSSGNAFEVSQTGNVGLFSGNLFMSSTDVSLNGRAGLGFSIVREYNSNIFLHFNRMESSSCLSENGALEKQLCTSQGWGTANCNKVCPNCLVFESLTEIGAPARCSIDDARASSFIKPKLLGRGWDMTFGKIQDPTELASTVNEGLFGTFNRLLPKNGVNTQSLILNNRPMQLYLPSSFKLNNPDLAGSTWSADASYIDAPFAAWNEAHETISPYKFTLFTSDGSPVFMTYLKAGDEWGEYYYPEQATYFDRSGKRYHFTNYVRFRGPYDDLPDTDTSNINNLYSEEIFSDWAQNPYAGLYLTEISDTFGNFIRINYACNIAGYGNYPNPCPDGSPFISSITDTFGRSITFNYYPDPNGVPLYRRLKSICYPTYNSETVQTDCIHYYYEDYNGDTYQSSKRPLLLQVQLEDQNGVSRGIPATTYSYDEFFDEDWGSPNQNYNSQELSKITYPTGGSVEYDFSFIDSWPVLNYVFGYNDPSSSSFKKRAIVEKREISNGKTNKWNYDYQFPQVTTFKMEDVKPYVIVTDPLQKSKISYFYPVTVMPTSINTGGGMGGMLKSACDSQCSDRIDYVQCDCPGPGCVTVCPRVTTTCNTYSGFQCSA